jgi:hypothetical protein
MPTTSSCLSRRLELSGKKGMLRKPFVGSGGLPKRLRRRAMIFVR